MSDPNSFRVAVGDDRRTISVLQRPGAAPGIFWLGGFRSEMTGTKAEALDGFCARAGLAVTRFDYSGHGQSGGDFGDGTISRWLEEALAVLALTEGPQIVVGSSMGGWLALLLARVLRERSAGERLKGLVLIAPAVDMTEALMKPSFSHAELEDLINIGYVSQPSQYSDEPYVLTRNLIEDGAKHLLFDGPISAGCPIHILQGGRDPDVPQAQALKLISHLLSDPVSLTLIPDGDHRLSRPQDLARLEQAVQALCD